MKLTAKAVEKLRHEGPLHFRDIKDDGTPGLYLRILVSGEKRWIMRYKLGDKTRVGTFGDAGKIGLADARTKAFAAGAFFRPGKRTQISLWTAIGGLDFIADFDLVRAGLRPRGEIA